MSKVYYGIYRGLVVQNNDKTHAGLVKVFVPGVTYINYENFRYKNIEDKVIKYFGDRDKGSLSVDDIAQLRIHLPWASMGMPVTSEGSSYRYNTRSHTAMYDSGSEILDNSLSSINFAHHVDTSEMVYSEKSGAIYEDEEYRLSDAFDGTNRNVKQLNPSTFNYKPSTYSAGARGEFGIPNVGAVVAVQFFNGDPRFPFVTHVIYGSADWGSLYDETEYPGSFENTSVVEGEYNHNIDKYRSKYILNQKGGTIEINNTDNNEKIKVTHYSGSFKEFNNQTNIELATNNDQKLVQGDQFLTVKGNQNIFIGTHRDKCVEGDDYEKIGNLNKAVVEAWKNEVRELANLNQLFNTTRTDGGNIITDSDGNIIVSFNSPTQVKIGTPTDNPNIKKVDSFSPAIISAANKQLDTIKQVIKDKGTFSLPKMTIAVTINGVTKMVTIGGDKIDLIGNALEKIKIPTVKIPNLIDYSNQLLSLSSADGNYLKDPQKQLIKDLYISKLPSLIELEKKMGIGGSKIIQITKDKVETIGMTMNDYGSIRIDSVGKSKPSRIKLGSYSAYTEELPSPLIEYVSVQPLPGGAYTLNVCDRFNVLVGAGGFSIKSYGGVNISGTITNIAGEQVNIASRNEVNIASDKRLEISASILVLRQKNQGQVLVDSNLGISRNVIIGGGAYIEGETYLQHVTAPLEYQYTNTDGNTLAGMPSSDSAKALAIAQGAVPGITTGTAMTYQGANKTGYLLGFCNVTVDSVTHTGCCPVYIATNACIETYPHRHMFPNLPLTLKEDPNKVRDDAKEKGNEQWKSSGISMGYKGDM